MFYSLGFNIDFQPHTQIVDLDKRFVIKSEKNQILVNYEIDICTINE